MVAETDRARARDLLNEAGFTYAADASITLRDKPAPLFQLSVLVALLSKPIGAELAVAGARELFRSGYRTPQRMRAATWQQRVDALGRGHYRRYDESTATILDEAAGWLITTYSGDLRRLVTAGDHDPRTVAELLEEMPGIGPVGASIYLREAQHVWPWLRPYADDRVVAAARDLGLPHSLNSLCELAGSQDLSSIGAALIRKG